MNYFSLNNRDHNVTFKDAVIRGQAPGKGLYFPSYIPQLENDFFAGLDKLSTHEIAFRVMLPYVSGTIPNKELQQIVDETLSFPIPLVQVSDDIFSLELFHGPTLAFKDVGARFMSRCLRYFSQNDERKVTVLVATSGDTGGAVANGFYEVDNVDVVILYPSGKVSNIQEKQLTTLGKNIRALEIKGTFDDCQAMVKQAFIDEELNEKMFLTSANSINVARWLPQQLYYFLALKQWKYNTPPVISVPGGNFGNIGAGMLAKASGLPVKHFIAACNANDVIPEFLKTEKFKPKPAVATLSNAMDVGDPSNFNRLMELNNNDISEIKRSVTGYSISDDETKETIRKVFTELNYLLDPHGAVGYLSLRRYLDNNQGDKGIFLETAHPVKFNDSVEPVINQQIEIPASIAPYMLRDKLSITMEADYSAFKNFLLNQ